MVALSVTVGAVTVIVGTLKSSKYKFNWKIWTPQYAVITLHCAFLNISFCEACTSIYFKYLQTNSRKEWLELISKSDELK